MDIPGYVVEGELGRGGMGVVYRATHLRLQRTVALKILAPELSRNEDFRARFDDEARIAASIEHPNVIPIYDAGDADGQLYLAMRYIEGTDLAAAIAAHGALAPQRAATLTAEIGDALDAAHARGLVHRDVKPANILIGTDDRAYLTDFGLTKLIDASGLTQTGQIVGTPHYMAPEQVEGRRVDARSDVYSLGCALFHALVGRVPFARPSTPAVMYAHVHEPPPLASADQPALGAFDAVLQRALAKDPDERFPSAGDLGRAALAAAGSATTVPPERSVARGEAAPAPETQPAPTRALPTVAPVAAGPTVAVPPPSGGRRSGAVAGAVIAAIAAAVAVGAVLLISNSGGDSPSDTTTTTATSAATTPTRETPTEQPAALTDWPEGEDGFAVILASTKKRSVAEAVAQRAAKLGPAGVLNSSDYSSLRPGFWVAFVGPLKSPKAAQRAAKALRNRGFTGAYPRRVAR